MKSLWDESIAKAFETDLDLRVYTSRLLGKDNTLALHGYGNTSVKTEVVNVFGEKEQILYVTGSGREISNIKTDGFSPVKMETLLKIAQLKELSNADMVKNQRVAMSDPYAPTPSMSAILHAIVPFKFVEHTHSDAILTITNTDNAKEKIEEIYGDRVLTIPYIIPGFELVKVFYSITKNIDWSAIDGIVLLNHGLFTFDDSAKLSYEKTVNLVAKAEEYLKQKEAIVKVEQQTSTVNMLDLVKIRKEVCDIKGASCISMLNESDEAIYFSKTMPQKAPREDLLQKQFYEIPSILPLTPEHAIITKAKPAIIDKNIHEDLQRYVKEYEEYFNTYKHDTLTCLNTAPKYAVLKDRGLLAFASSQKQASLITEINNHTITSIFQAGKLGGYKGVELKSVFEVEYSDLEQAKIKKDKHSSEYEAKVAVITRYTSEAGLKCAKILNNKGAIVVSLNINDELDTQQNLQSTIEKIIKSFGGVDMVVDGLDVYTSTNLPKSSTKSLFLSMITPYLKYGVKTNVGELICAINQPLL